ncbi:MAG: thiamine-phosphate kinase [Fibrobacterota bacterium]
MKSQDESQLIDKIDNCAFGSIKKEFLCGIGDDCAVRTTDGSLHIYSADTLVQNIHFCTDWMSFTEIGWKAAAVNLSDIAAMGGQGDALLVQVVIPRTARDVHGKIAELYTGINRCCNPYDVHVVGGDLTAGSEWVIAVTVMGRVRRPLYRSGARYGDILWCTGNPGRSAAGLDWLRTEGRERAQHRAPAAIQAHIAPIPRLDAAALLGPDTRVHAMIDISDGIAKEAGLICDSSHCGCRINLPDSLADSLPQSPLRSKEECFLSGGEDYELLFTADAAFTPPPSVPCTPVGTITGDRALLFESAAGVRPLTEQGWDHFA